MTPMAAPKLPELTLPQMLRLRRGALPNRIAIRQKDFGIWQPVTWAANITGARAMSASASRRSG